MSVNAVVTELRRSGSCMVRGFVPRYVPVLDADGDPTFTAWGDVQYALADPAFNVATIGTVAGNNVVPDAPDVVQVSDRAGLRLTLERITGLFVSMTQFGDTVVYELQ